MRSPLSRRIVLVVGASDVAAFAEVFASLATLADRQGLAVGCLKPKLDAAKLIPTFPGSRMRSAIYRVADLPGHLVTGTGRAGCTHSVARGSLSKDRAGQDVTSNRESP